MNLILIEPAELSSRGEVTLVGARAAHVREVLAAAPGQEVRVGLIDGPRGTGTVQTIADEAVTLQCTFESDPPPRPRVDVLLALPRPKVMRRLWAQLSALGVGQIILTNAGKVERNYFDTHVLAPALYRSLLLEGLQQVRDTRVPDVSVHRQFRKLIETDLDGLVPDGLRLVADPSGDRPVRAAVRASAPQRCLVAIGPEGGWNAFELDVLALRGFHAVSLGARALRTDTACVALLSLVHEALMSLED